jgi:hypothetical protein
MSFGDHEHVCNDDCRAKYIAGAQVRTPYGHSCWYVGCRRRGGIWYIEVHEMEPHVPCRCGRAFMHSLAKHLGALRRRGFSLEGHGEVSS